MAFMTWDNTGEKVFEAGVDRGVLYRHDGNSLYGKAYPWNGLTAVTESPSGAEANKFYADNIVYGTMMSAEELGGTIEAYTYPDEFGPCNGEVSPTDGLTVGQQTRVPFGFSYRTKVGNDVEGLDYGYKIHLWYNCLAAPSEKGFTTINESPEAVTLSWEITTTPVPAGESLKPTALLVVDSTKVTEAGLAALEAVLYDTTTGRLPTPTEVITLLGTTSGGGGTGPEDGPENP